MTDIDNKVVSIKFDNAGFQQKIQETMASLDQLNTKLAMPNAKSGLSDIQASANSFNLGPMTAAIDGISAKFLAMSTIAITAISNIVNKAVDAGTQLAKSLTITPITAGFSEYELKMGSIQTIMAGSGASLDEVNAKLQELNEYSDRTIYSFGDMTSNIGKFTNAGVSLDDSVAAIQGVANVAALSGANAGEASRAMYNFGQALGQGSVKLMDWKSIELANMGTVEFKQQLIDSAVAMGTLTKVGDGLYKTLQGTEVTTSNFGTTLADNWLTTEALTETLGRYSDATTDIGARATKAATEIKSFSQMIDTMKESAGSGWATTFETIFGDFEEGKTLWTDINDVFGGMITASANARNEMLAGWKNMGGRDVMIQAFKDVFGAIGDVLAPIKDAFRDIFPKTTAGDLVILTGKFSEFAKKLTVSGETADKIKRTFSGVFSIFKIGVEVVKGIIGVFGAIFGALKGAGGGVLGFTANVGDMLVRLREMLVEGGGIADFFGRIGEYAATAVGFIKDFVSNIAGFFSGFSGSDAVANGVERVGERLGILGTIAAGAGAAWDWLVEQFGKVKEALGPVGDLFTNLGDTLKNLFKPGDFSGTLDAINVGLFGGLVLLVKRFLDGGLKLDLGDGLFEKIGETFDQLTETLQAMQMKVKAEALMKIAIAVGVLTASVLVLSLIDSGALTKALLALSVGFGQLIGAMVLIDKFSGTTSGPKLAAIGGGMILLAGAVLILSFAVRSLSSLSWTELAKGLLGVTVLLGALSGAVKLMSGDTKGLIRAGIAMMAMGVALLILSVAVKAFAEMSWGEMAQGMVGVAVGLGILVVAMKNMPKGMLGSAVGMIAMAAGLLVLQKAVSAFAGMNVTDMLRGFVGIALGLTLIVVAMRNMPPNMLLSAAGILVMGFALKIIAGVIESLGGMDIASLAKGLGAMAATLLILAVATNFMTGAIPGAIAMIIVAGALVILTGVIQALSQLSIGELAMALGAIAGVFLVLGIAAALLTPVIPALMGLGVALALIGGAFALFGLGASLVAKAFETIARAGKKGVQVVIDIMEELIKALPGFIKTLAGALIEMAMTFLNAAPAFIEAIAKIIGLILEKVIEMTPQFVEAFSALLTGAIDLMREYIPQFITLAIEIIIALMTGIRDNIYQIATLAVEIITNFAQALTDNMSMIVSAAVNLIISFTTALGDRATDLVTAGINLLAKLIEGLRQNIGTIVTAVADLIIAFLGALAVELPRIVTAGTDLLIKFVEGIASNLLRVVEAAINIITTFITEIGNGASKIVTAGAEALGDFIEGLGQNISDVVTKGTEAATEFITGIGNAAEDIITAGAEALADFITGLERDVSKVVDAGVDAVIKFIEGLGKNAVELANAAMDVMIDFLNGLTKAIETKDYELQQAGRDLAWAIADGFTLGLAGKAREMANSVTGALGGALDKGKSLLGIKSPSKEFFKIGQYSAEGFALGMNRDRSIEKSVVDKFGSVLNSVKTSVERMKDELSYSDEFNPVITPVLDLTKISSEARRLRELTNISSISPEVSFNRARNIATTAEVSTQLNRDGSVTGTKEVRFEQNIYAPSALSTNDIYRNTKSQIALAKEELDI